MFDVDGITLWKVFSIVSAGGFGILGLLTQYKDASGRVTNWGKVSLVGILISTIGGAAVQIKESSDNERSAAVSRAQTLTIVKQTQRAVENMDRLLRPLDAPALSAWFKVPCDHEDFAAFCRAVQTAVDADRDIPLSVWNNWPSSQMNHLPHKAETLVSVAIFGKDSAQKSGQSRARAAADWQFEYWAPPTSQPGRSKNAMNVFIDQNGDVAVDLNMDAPSNNSNEGTLQSMLDLEGAEIVLSVSSTPIPMPNPKQQKRAKSIKPENFRLSFRNGQNIELATEALAEGRAAFSNVDKSFSAKISLKRH